MTTSGNGNPANLEPGSAIALLTARIAQLMHYGTVIECNYECGKFRVRIGEENPFPDPKAGKADTKTYWLPIATARAGANRSWIMPEMDDQVMVFAPNGHIANGFIAFSVNKEGHAPHAALDGLIQRWVWGHDPDLLATMLDQVDRNDWHRMFYFRDDGYFVSTVGRDYAASSTIWQDKDHISFRVADTSIIIRKDRIDLQVNGKKTQIALTASAIIAQVLDKSFLKIEADKIDMQVQELSQLKLDVTNILQRVDKAVSILEADKWKAELTEQKVKLSLVADGIGFQTDKASQTITSTGDITLTSSGAMFKMQQANMQVRALDYDAQQIVVMSPDYQAAQAPEPSTPPVIPVYVPRPRPAMVPGNDPSIPPTPAEISE